MWHENLTIYCSTVLSYNVGAGSDAVCISMAASIVDKTTVKVCEHTTHWKLIVMTQQNKSTMDLFLYRTNREENWNLPLHLTGKEREQEDF